MSGGDTAVENSRRKNPDRAHRHRCRRDGSSSAMRLNTGACIDTQTLSARRFHGVPVSILLSHVGHRDTRAAKNPAST